MSGIDVIVAVNGFGIRVPWLLMSGWMTVELAVTAITAVTVPCDIENSRLALGVLREEAWRARDADVPARF
jgi:hypothetical protein